MEKRQLTRRRACAALYGVATLVTAGLLIAALCGKGGPAVQLYFSDALVDILGVFLPFFVAEYLLWRTAVYLFCTSERTVRRMVFTVLYGLLGLGMLVFPFHLSVKLNVKWWLIGAYADLRGVDALADILRSRREKKGRLDAFFFILIALSVALFVMVFAVSLWGFLFPRNWGDAFLFVAFTLLAPPLMLAVGLLRKCVLTLSDGTGGKVFPYLYGGIAVGIFVAEGINFTGSALPWVLVFVYGIVQTVDTLLSDVRVPHRKGHNE